MKTFATALLGGALLVAVAGYVIAFPALVGVPLGVLASLVVQSERDPEP